ncbi:MAG: stage II sporulation protein M [Calditrichaeota bacterium]|nr:MAG: stage II sporulation protein M [Calditrichota bacterium]
MFSDLFDSIRVSYLFISGILFFCGIYFAPYAVEKGWNWLLVYPRWMFRILEKYLQVNFRFLILFTLIFVLNNISLFLSFISGYTIILPLLAAFFTGFNIAVISFDMAGWRGIWHMFINPVAWLEFPAGLISFAMGFQLAEYQLRFGKLEFTNQMFQQLLPLYFKYVMTILLIAALLESALIVLAQKFDDGTD